MRRIALLSSLALCLTVAFASEAAAQPFHLFEAMLFSGTPDFARLGLQHIRIVDVHELWKAGEPISTIPTADTVRKITAAGVGPSGYLVIDIEHWTASDANYKLGETLSRFRAASPNMKLGLYSILPQRDYWRAIGEQGVDNYHAWQVENDRVRALVARVDALFPSLYTFYPDQDGWERYATANIAEARRLAKGKPVYCFLWPQYHDSYELLAADYWRRELDTCRRLADGIVIWGGFKENPGFKALPWSDQAPWWQATLQFLRVLR